MLTWLSILAFGLTYSALSTIVDSYISRHEPQPTFEVAVGGFCSVNEQALVELGDDNV